MRAIIGVVIAALLTGCGVYAVKKYKGVSFDSFIDARPGNEQSDTQSKWAYRVRSLGSEQPKTLIKEFGNWCHAQDGQPTQYEGGPFLRDAEKFWGRDGWLRGACTDKTNTTIAAYFYFWDGNVAFYTEAQERVLHAEIERRDNERRVAREAKMRKRSDECSAEVSAMRDNLKPGMRTFPEGGMVVEVKPPLAQVQVLGPDGSTLRWERIATLLPWAPSCD